MYAQNYFNIYTLYLDIFCLYIAQFCITNNDHIIVIIFKYTLFNV